MPTKLHTVLFIDDDHITNFLHRSILKKTNLSQEIKVVETVNEAVELLETQGVEQGRIPELIFVDLNMPGKTGWDFLESYQRLKDQYSLSSVIVILSASANVDDVHRARTIKEVAEFQSKPLTIEMLEQIVSKYFH